MKTAQQIWDEFRRTCCQDDLGDELHWQRLGFIAGLSAGAMTLCCAESEDDVKEFFESIESATEQALEDYRRNHTQRN